MSNIDQAKEKLKEKSALESLLSPCPPPFTSTKTPKNRLPLQRDIQMIERILDEKLKFKQNQIEEKILNEYKTKFSIEIQEIHEEAVILHKRVQKLINTIEKESQGLIIDGNRGYWSDLPEKIEDTEDTNYIRISDNDAPIITEIKNEISEYILNLKIGIAPMADVKILLDKIEKI